MNLKNWQHLCIFGRLCPSDIEIVGKIIYHDDRCIKIGERYSENGPELTYTDEETNEILLIQGVDGFPVYKSEWADSEPTCPYQIA